MILCILYADISDHLPVILTTDLKVKHMKKSCYYYSQSFDNASKHQFIESVQKIDWSAVIGSDGYYKTFSQRIMVEFNTCFPIIRHKTNKKNTPRKPWTTKGLANSCIKKERLYKAYIANPNDCNREKYKTYMNKLTKTLRAAEKDYYIKKFDAATHDMKKKHGSC